MTFRTRPNRKALNVINLLVSLSLFIFTNFTATINPFIHKRPGIRSTTYTIASLLLFLYPLRHPTPSRGRGAIIIMAEDILNGRPRLPHHWYVSSMALNCMC